MNTYPFPARIDRVVCSDLDETFLPFSDIDKPKSGIPILEDFLFNNISSHNLIFGWITGSNLKSALNKTRQHINYLPHFIASSLGTEFYWIKNGEAVEPASWINLLSDSGYSKQNVTEILNALSLQGIDLIFQPEDYQGKYKSAFYYFIKNSQEEDFEQIKKIAFLNKCKVLFNRSNPAAGDPENSYDVEFIPTCCGKGEVVDFLKSELSLNRESFYAFGDSFNDFSMFSKVGHAFLVANADPMAKIDHPHVLSENYCLGIVNKLKQLL